MTDVAAEPMPAVRDDFITPQQACMYFKNFYSTCLLIFSITIIMGLIFSGQTRIASEIHPALAFVLIWGAVLWLAMVEGGQGPIVGLPPVDVDLYKDTHPRTYMSTKITNKGDNLDRYLMGRQFMVVLLVFITNLSGAPLPNSVVFGFPPLVTEIFLNSGVAMILMTAMIGQLSAQVNASHMMLDFINNYFAVFTLYVAMVIEFSGLLHASYVIQLLVAWLAGKPIETHEEKRGSGANLFFWARCIMSIGILGYACAVTFAALFEGKTTMWPGIPGGAAVIIFIVLASCVGLLEGMQIAFFAVTKLPKEEQGKHKFAMKTCELLFRGEGVNLPGFMIGRQICVTLCWFVAARVTTMNVVVGTGENIFGVSDGFQTFLNNGLLGAVLTTILASISWQLVASAFPIAFLSNPIVFIFLRLCLWLEATGICSGAWVIAWCHAKLCGFQRDEVYIGTPEERAAKHHADHKENQEVEPGHPRIPVYPVGDDHFPMSDDEDVTEREGEDEESGVRKAASAASSEFTA
jgi:silicon transporter